MGKKSGKYEITDKDITSVINWLKIEDSENATPEMAIAILKNLQASIHMLGHKNPEALKKAYSELKRSRKVKN